MTPDIEQIESEAARADFIEVNLENSVVMSRTRGGVSDTSSSVDKPKLLIEGEALAERTEGNHRAALEFVWRHRDDDFTDPRTVEAFVLTLADQISDGLLQPGQDRLRTWETDYHIHPDLIDGEFEEFCHELSVVLSEEIKDPVWTAAWIEQRLDGQIHPFADGCARTAKTLSAFVLAREGHELPRYRGREEYYGVINENLDDWYQHYASYFRPAA